MTVLGPINVNLYSIVHDSHLIEVPQQLFLLKRAFQSSGFLLWERKGMYGIVPLEIIENALTRGCMSDISWEQTLFVPPKLAKLLLQHAQEPGKSANTEQTSTGSESDQG